MSESVYKGIRDVANIVGVETHTLRFWEKKFPYLNPKKVGRHNRVYSPDDVAYLQRIYHYLRNEGYTIQGVLKLIKVHGVKAFREGSITDSAGDSVLSPIDGSHAEKPHAIQSGTLVADVENILARLQQLRKMLNE